jgi:hypothetical protein
VVNPTEKARHAPTAITPSTESTPISIGRFLTYEMVFCVMVFMVFAELLDNASFTVYFPVFTETVPFL